MKEKNLDNTEALENLKFIKQVISDSRTMVIDNGYEYLVWGILVTFGQIANFISYEMQIYKYIGFIWLVILIVGWSYMFYNRKKEKENPVFTFSEKIINSIWISALISITVTGLSVSVLLSFGIHDMISGYAVNSIIAIILGGAYFLTGVVNDYKWFKLIAVAWWLGGAGLFFVKAHYTFLAFAIMMVFLQIIPGLVINRIYKKQKIAKIAKIAKEED